MENIKLNSIITSTSTRLAFPHIFEPHSINDGPLYYSALVLIPKDDDKTLSELNKAVDAAIQIGSIRYGEMPDRKKLLEIIKDGDGMDPQYNFPGYYCLNTRSKVQPQIVDRDASDISDTKRIHSGCYTRVMMQLFPYNFKGKIGITCSLGGVQLVKDGEDLKPARTSNIFEALEDEELKTEKSEISEDSYDEPSIGI